MDNQHRRITGYRDLSQAEIDLINEGKDLAVKVGAYVEKRTVRGDHNGTARSDVNPLAGPDQRWVALGRTHLQQGFMALARSIAKPSTF